MITFFTLVLDGQPWVAHHYPVFCQLQVPWRWIVVEGVADNVNCTSWCAKIAPRLSNDGTNEYLRYLAAKDERVRHLQQPLWPGKVAMVNSALDLIQEPCVLMEIDSDELWTTEQLAKIEWIMSSGRYSHAMFWCDYYVGADRLIEFRANSYGNNSYEWKRAWSFLPAMRFVSHEPPVLAGECLPMPHIETFNLLGRFRHMALVTRKSVEFRARYYAGSSNPNAHLWQGAVEAWERLQKAQLPCRLCDYLKWVDRQATVVKAQS